jgi:hypothetical protein
MTFRYLGSFLASSFSFLRGIYCRYFSELFQKTGLQHHLSCPDRRCWVTKQPSEVKYWSPYCPDFVSFRYPLPLFYEDMFYCLFSMPTRALASVGSVDAVNIGSQTDLASPHLCDGGTNCAGQVFVYLESFLIRSNTQGVKEASMFPLLEGCTSRPGGPY